jgi:hypothetical protein
MHKSQEYISSVIFPGKPSATIIRTRCINGSEANLLLNHLHNDALSYLYSATISLGDAIVEIKENLFTWTTVKLYYTTFYALRSLLAFDGGCIFRIGSESNFIYARAGSFAEKEEKQTHKAVLHRFSIHIPSHFLLSQLIESENPLNWLMNKREEANYRRARFFEPNPPRHFEKIMHVGIRNVINAYMTDSSVLYLFDPDHAILSYPLRALQFAYTQLKLFNHLKYTEEEMKYLKNLFRDKRGPIPEIYEMIGG